MKCSQLYHVSICLIFQYVCSSVMLLKYSANDFFPQTIMLWNSFACPCKWAINPTFFYISFFKYSVKMMKVNITFTAWLKFILFKKSKLLFFIQCSYLTWANQKLFHSLDFYFIFYECQRLYWLNSWHKIKIIMFWGMCEILYVLQ